MKTTFEEAEKIAKNIGIYLGRVYLYEQSKRDRKHRAMASRSFSIHNDSKSNGPGRLLRFPAIQSNATVSDRPKPIRARG